MSCLYPEIESAGSRSLLAVTSERPGAREWRESIDDHAKAEQELCDRLAGWLLGTREGHPGGQVVDEVKLRGSYPDTELVVIFRAEEWFPGRTLGYAARIWDDPDDQSLFDMYFDEVINRPQRWWPKHYELL